MSAGVAASTRPGYAAPGPDNGVMHEHVELICDSLRRLTGRELIDNRPGPDEMARAVYHAPFALLSHTTDPEPVLNYANRCCQQLFELDWDTLVITPSRLTAEVPDRAERERLLRRVTESGVIDDYSGIRVSATGRRFRIEQATVWNLVDATGRYRGQAALFHRWQYL
jgi:hypothetical protein